MNRICKLLAGAALVVAGSTTFAFANNCNPRPAVVKCECCPAPAKHRRVVHAAPQKPAPAVEVETPVVHETHIKEVVIVEHEIIEMPTKVVAPRVPTCSVCGQQPQQRCNTCGGQQPLTAGLASNASPIGQLIHNGCPAGVKIGDIFACDSHSGQCICH